MTTIHFSAIPWLNFTSLSHASYTFSDSSPTFGKMTISENGKEPCPYQFMYTMD
jgi:chloramphenicol O-acetyltransferase type A